jgi:hypothetical protein
MKAGLIATIALAAIALIGKTPPKPNRLGSELQTLGTLWCLRAAWFVLVLACLVLPIGARASLGANSVEAALNALAGSVIAAIIAVVATQLLRTAGHSSE